MSRAISKYSTDGYRLTRQGMRDLDKPVDKSKARPVTIPAVKQPLLDEALHTAPIRDLLYVDGADIRSLIKERFSEAVLELESRCDYIHGDRLEVVVNCSEKAWLSFVILEGLDDVSLCCQIRMMGSPRTVIGLLDEIDPE